MLPSVDELSIQAVIDEISRNFGTFRDVFAILGAFYATKVCMSVTYTCYRAVKVYVLPKIWFGQDFPKRYGEWAVVTGASEGIGRSYAIELAKRGMNVVLISRSYIKLEKVETEIESKYGVKAKIVTADFSDSDCYAKIEQEIAGLEIGMLVNNVGIMYEDLQYFLTVSSERLKQIVNVNIMSTLLMTRMVLPQMVERKKGAVINVSSGSSVQPIPLMTAYSAAKMYTDYFSRALNYEYGKDGIIVQCVQPFYVSTRMTHFMKPSIMAPDAETYVHHAVKTLQFTSRTYGYWSHALMGFIAGLLPERLCFWAAINVNLPLWNILSGR